jgi:MraZ protein
MSLFLNTALFLNTHANRIDGKGRVSFPAPFRTALTTRNSAGVVLFQSLTHEAIEGWPAERMQNLSESLDGLDVFSEERAHLATAIFGSAQDLIVDKEGRCSLPKSLCDYAGITTEASFIGLGETFQIWEPSALAKHAKASIAGVKHGGAGLQLLKKPAGSK